ncbi:MAG: UDP-N-acetylmuramoyl-L-alanyl-D-glutamate--2,6-diaminopimelate ligase [Alphaproteobacteria bacterium]
MQLDKFLETVKYPESFTAWSRSKKPLHTFSIESIVDDSRKVTKGSLFVAISGTETKGDTFIPDAISKGATVIAATPDQCKEYALSYPDMCFIETKIPRRFLAFLGAAFYPKQPENIVAVTGTNGKTSVVNFVRQIWEHLGYKAASLGTLGIQSTQFQQQKHLTTPDPLYLHSQLDAMTKKNITHLAMESSSHGLDQHRLDAVHLKAAAFTNLSPDHLDYHKTLEAYLDAKRQLFKRILPPQGTTVLNADIPEFETLKNSISSKILTYGRKGAQIHLESLTPLPHGQTLKLRIFGNLYHVNFPLIGEFQVYNALCALGLVLAVNPEKTENAIQILDHLQGIPGRLEFVGSHPNGAPVYVDYAHASGGIETLLKTMRAHIKGDLWVVFGAGGGRDPSTRPLMGKAASAYADHVVITDDNPRFEDPQIIRQQLLKGCPDAIEIPDRPEAINYAIHHLKPQDALVVTGKGPEDGQIIKGVTYPFLDKSVIENILSGMKK